MGAADVQLSSVLTTVGDGDEMEVHSAFILINATSDGDGLTQTLLESAMASISVTGGSKFVRCSETGIEMDPEIMSANSNQICLNLIEAK